MAAAVRGGSGDGTVTASVFGYGLGFLAFWGIAHASVRRFAPAGDPVLLPLVVTLNGLGLAMIYRLKPATASRGQRVFTQVIRGVRWLRRLGSRWRRRR